MLFWHLLNPLQLLLSLHTWETRGYDSDVLGCITSRALKGSRDFYLDGISSYETLPRSQSLGDIGLSLERNMMWKMAIGWWRLIQKKHEQWSIWWLVHWRETLIAVSSATWWILGGKRPTGNARRVIYDGSVTPRAMLLGWRIPWDNENNFLSATRRRVGPETERWDEIRVAWNFISFGSLTFRRIKFAGAFFLHFNVIVLHFRF